MVIFKKMLLPLIKKYFRLFLSMVIISSMGIAAIIGLIGLCKTLDYGVNNYIDEYGYQDILIDVNLTKRSLSDIENLDSVEKVDSRLYMDVSVKSIDKTLTARMFTYKDTDYKKFYVRDEIQKTDGIPISIDLHFAEGNNIHVGDTLTVCIFGYDIEVYCQRIVSCPECISIKQNPYIYGESSDYGYFYIDLKEIEDTLDEYGYKNYYNQLQIYTNKTKSNQETYDEIKEVMGSKFKITDYTLFEDSFVKLSIDSNIPPLEQLSRIVPVLFFVITMLIIFLFMYQIINMERKNVGIYKALGFKNKEIIPLFLMLGFVISIVSSILGTIFGYIIEYTMMLIYFDIFQMPFYIPNLPWGYVFLFCGINVVVCLLSVLFSSLPIFKVEPKEAMMVQGSDMRDPRTIKKLKLPISIKLSITIIVRNLKRFIFSALCISTAIFMLLAGFLLANAGNLTINQTYNKRFNFDCIVYYSKKIPTKEIENLDKNENIIDYEIAEYTLANYDDTNFVVLGLPDTKIMSIIDSDGKSLTDLDDGLIISTRLSDELNLHVGDIVNIQGKDIPITKISRQYVSALCYMKKEKMAEYDIDSSEILLATIKDKDLMNEFIVKTSNYISIEYKENLYKYTLSCYNNIKPAIYILVFIAVVIGSVIIYNISQINLLESQNEIGIMKTLGVRQSYVNRTWLMESLFKYLFASLLGIPLGAIFGKFVLGKMKTRVWEYPYELSLSYILLTLGITLGFVLICHFLSMRKIEKWNLADLCRQKE